MASTKVLVVDDEHDILELIRFNLEREGFNVITVDSGEAALAQATRLRPDVVVLDLMLPGLDGIEVCRRLKENELTREIPVLMLTARTEDADIVTGLDVGADDYVTKPFSPKVLVARIRTIIRRRSAGHVTGDEDLLVVHGIRIDIARHEVRVGDRDVNLSATEFAIMVLLARNPGWVFSRTRIIDSVKGKDYPVTERSVDVQILGLRKKLADKGRLVETVRGVGYRLRAE
jgi:two-component system, OmpR family, alkaline phosphatase synthesis response regulator PhoP